MLDVDAQREVFERVREAAARHGLLVAPIGSVYFLLMGEARALTKDVDAVVHLEDNKIPPLERVVALAGEFGGDVEVAEQKSIVVVTIRDAAAEPVTIELLRGRDRPGFLNRALLLRAAALATREDNVIHYPIEFVITLKAEASVDRRNRARKRREAAAKMEDLAERKNALAMGDRNEARAEDFARDVFSQMSAAAPRGLSEERFVDALAHVKESWRGNVAELLEAASGGSLRLLANPRLFPS